MDPTEVRLRKVVMSSLNKRLGFTQVKPAIQGRLELLDSSWVLGAVAQPRDPRNVPDQETPAFFCVISAFYSSF